MMGQRFEDPRMTSPVLHDDTHFLQVIASNASDMIVLLDHSGRRLYANPSFVRTFGAHAAQLGADSFDNIHPDDRERMRALFSAVLAEGTGMRAEYRIIDRHGAVRYLESQSNVIQTAGQSDPYVVVVSRETTERREAEEALSQENIELEARIAARTAQLTASKEQLERTISELQIAHQQLREREEDARRTLDRERELNELKLRFVSMTSHEFRTPLTMIHSAAQLLCEYDNRLTGDERQDILNDITSAVGRMTLMLEEVLTISRADAGRLEFAPKPIALAEYSRKLADEIDKSSQKSHCVIVETPETDQSRLADEKLLRLILTNLLTNAIKYSDKGSEVRLQVAFEEAATRFEISDQGIGIPQHEQSQMFETFYRASNVGQIPGTGLGLAIVRRAVQRHGGEIRCESNMGRGTRFVVRLPTQCTD